MTMGIKRLGQAIKRFARQLAARNRAKAAARKNKHEQEAKGRRSFRYRSGPPQPRHHYRKATEKKGKPISGDTRVTLPQTQWTDPKTLKTNPARIKAKEATNG